MSIYTLPISSAISRRQVAKAMGAIGTMSFISGGLHATTVPRKASANEPRLIVIELQGGNDSLNTLVPYRDPAYRHLRPTIGVPAAELIPINDDVALNGALKNVAALYQRGKLAVVQDVGYPKPNLSHFESAAIWASGDPDAIHGDGWITHVLTQKRADFALVDRDADGIVLGGNADLLAGRGVHVLSVDDPAAFIATPTPAPAPAAIPNSAFGRIYSVLEDQALIGARLRRKISGTNRFNAWFEKGHYIDVFEQQIALMLWMIESEVYAPVVKVSLSGFDMHVNLRGAHEALLTRFDRAVAAITQGLQEIGAWQNTLVLAASEFGRRPSENASAGTDHGTAGAVFIFGGPVNGGVFGARADLTGLDSERNLTFQTDFRSIYRDVVTRFWRLPSDPFDRVGHGMIGFV